MNGHVVLLATLAFSLAAQACGGRPTEKGPPARQPDAKVEDGFDAVAFLVGDWEGSSSTGRFDEHWVAPRGGLMLGLGRELDASGAAGFFELLRIERRSSGLVLVPHPFGRPAQEFRLARAAPGLVVFQNDGTDRVVRISYARRGDQLTCRVELREGGRTDEFLLRRVDSSGCPTTSPAPVETCGAGTAGP